MNFKNNVMMKKAFGAAAAATMIFSTVAAPVFANETVIVAQDNAANDLNNSVSFSGTARLNGMDKVNTASLTHCYSVSWVLCGWHSAMKSKTRSCHSTWP